MVHNTTYTVGLTEVVLAFVDFCDIYVRRSSWYGYNWVVAQHCKQMSSHENDGDDVYVCMLTCGRAIQAILWRPKTIDAYLVRVCIVA